MRRQLISIGITARLLDLAWPHVARIPIGRLPGDFSFGSAHFRVRIALATTLLVSLILSVMLWVVRR